MVENEFYYDVDKYPRAKYSSPNETLGWYLEEDVQSSLATCDELHSICKEVSSDAKKRWEGIGNAYSILIECGNVTIKNEFDDDVKPCTVSIKEFQNAIKQWKELLEESGSGCGRSGDFRLDF